MSKLTNIAAVIPVRYGSKRFPGKPLALLLGKPLVQHTFEQAVDSGLFSSVIIATDDERIAHAVREFGGEVEMTSTDCPTGTDRVAEVLELRPELETADLIINVQGDEPIIERSVYLRMIHELEQDPEAVAATAAVPITDAKIAHDPHAVKCVLDQQGRALYFSRGLIPHGLDGSFDSNISYYHHLGLYAFRPDFLKLYPTLKPTPLQIKENLEQLKILEHGFAIRVAIVQSLAHGVDSPEDLKKMEEILCKKNTSL